ncbi:MAG TPA: hypothetical protein PKD48_10150 [Sphingopyxis sp.]|nr:hypothetical protein [Sphingopyxis sp.]
MAMPTRSRASKAAVGGRQIGRSGGRPAPRLPGWRSILYAAAMLLFWLAVTLFTGSSAMEVYSPSRAISLNPFNASAKAQLANDLVYISGDPEQVGTAAALSRAALDGNPTLPAAYRMIALENARGGKLAKPAILAATWLTRRDYIANLWLIEDAVKRGRMDEAMTEVDASLRTSRRSQALLFPILATAMAEPEMHPHFVSVFRRDPVWLPSFLGHYLSTQKLPAAPLAQVMLPIREELPASYRPLDRSLISLMVNQRDFAAARAYERAITGTATRDTRRIIHNGRFEAEGPYPPIDWHLFREASYGSDIEEREKGNRLIVVSDEEQPRMVARQLVELVPGPYRLSARGRIITGNLDAALDWRVDCAEKDGPRQLAALRIARGATGDPVDFTVPAVPCRNYWVSLNAAAGFGSESLQAEFQSVDLQPVR